jgi:uncharacterized protein YbaR (Trm112 family)
MPICPKCKHDIEELEYIWNEREYGMLSSTEYAYDGDEPEVISAEFYCQDCGALLFTSIEEAERFIGLR